MKVNHKILQKALDDCATLVNKKIDKLLIIKDLPGSNLLGAMRYSSLTGAKRIRPFLMMTCAELLNVSKARSIKVAVAIEFVHIYSLIHDDLPAMDDDNYRRGKLTCHKRFDEATAILAGDALLTYAFEILSNPKTVDNPEMRCELVTLMSEKAGFRGMISGQMIDIELKNQKLTKEKIIELQKLKTGKLFVACSEAASIIANANVGSRNSLKNYATYLGLAFQIRDDILDYEEKGSKHDNANIVGLIGLEDTLQELEIIKEKALAALNIFDFRADLLRDLVGFVVGRKK
jgi:farnesyl diphosphate synthase